MADNYRLFFETYFGSLPVEDAQGEVTISNPFRKDKNPSLGINLYTGMYNDFGSETFKGHAIQLYEIMHKVSRQAAKEAVMTVFLAGLKPRLLPIPRSKLLEWHNALLEDKELLVYLTKERGLTKSVIQERLIGHDGERYTIPILNEFGVCINVRRYKPKARGREPKIVSYDKGYGTVLLYPMDSLTHEEIYLHEGEWDALAQLSRGIPAITTTGGAGAWKSTWNPWFTGKIVNICYDVDDAGQQGALRVARELAGVAKEVRIVELPLAGEKDDKDITDFYVKHGEDAQDFLSIVAQTNPIDIPPEEIIVPITAMDKPPEYEGDTIPLREARNSKYKGQRVSFAIQVIGKNTTPYNVPTEVICACDDVGFAKKCDTCPMALGDGTRRIRLSENQQLLHLIKIPTSKQLAYVASHLNMDNPCKKIKMTMEGSVNLEELLMAPALTDTGSVEDSQEYIVQTAYFVDATIETNRSYIMEGIMTPDPWQQSVTFLLDTATPLQDTTSTFELTEDVEEELRAFEQGSLSVKDKLAEIHADLEENVTHIIGRNDLLTALDLVYHSVMMFEFNGRVIDKGVVECLCLGDTRTGKSETVNKILRHYQLGEITVAENTSFAGLVGGLQQTGDKRWFLTWGKIPLNHGRLLVIDEASGLSENAIAQMSGIRSSGIAEITKIQTERTHAKTRLLWLSNPRSGESLSSYGYGVLAVQELIGKAEDIARFDFALTAARDEVSMEAINTSTPKYVTHTYTSSMCKNLILWAWSRKQDDVVFTSEARMLILDGAIRMSEKYSARIPLVEGANQREKLAKLSVSVACRLFSHIKEGKGNVKRTKVLVTDEHVQFVLDYLDEIYSKPSLNYAAFSDKEFSDERAGIDNLEAVLHMLNNQPDLGECCMRQEFFSTRIFEEQLNLDKYLALEQLNSLIKLRMLKDSKGRGYVKTSGFNHILHLWHNARKEENID